MSEDAYALEAFGDRASELRRLQRQVIALRDLELPVYSELGLIGPVLDVGTGSGALAKTLLDEGLSVVGVDVDGDMLRSGAGYPRVAASGDRLPFGKRVFESAIARLVFQHLTNPGEVAREMLRVAGAAFIVDTDLAGLIVHPDPPSLRQARERWIGSSEGAGRDPFIGRKLRSILHEAGAGSVDTRTITITSDSVSRTTFAEMLLAPYTNWKGSDVAPDAARQELDQWADDPRSFGMATLVLARGGAR